MNRLPDELPIDDLSDRSWSRVEDAVFRELDHTGIDAAPRVVVGPPRRPLWRPVLGVAAVAAAAAVAAFVFLGSEAETPAPEPLASQRIVTADDSSQVSAGEASLDIAPQSALVMSGDAARGVVVVLERGSVECAVAPREQRPPFIVQAGDVRVEVVGTRFAVTRDGDSAVVEVMKGTVRVTAGGETTLVTAGEAWIAASALEEIDELDEIDEIDDIDDTVAAAPAPKAAAPKHNKRRRVAKRKPAPQPAPPPAAAPTAKERYRQAAALERTDPAAASAIYRDLARGSGTWASTALFARARLEHDRGNTATAAPLLRRYLKRFPGGPNAADARYLLGRVER